jgi:hypothetical protein
VNFIHRDKRQRCERQLSSAVHAALTSQLWECLKIGDASDDRRCNILSGTRLDEAFLYSESIDLTSYSRQRDKLREELTLAQIDRHTEAVDGARAVGSSPFDRAARASLRRPTARVPPDSSARHRRCSGASSRCRGRRPDRRSLGLAIYMEGRARDTSARRKR